MFCRIRTVETSPQYLSARCVCHQPTHLLSSIASCVLSGFQVSLPYALAFGFTLSILRIQRWDRPYLAPVYLPHLKNLHPCVRNIKQLRMSQYSCLRRFRPPFSVSQTQNGGKYSVVVRSSVGIWEVRVKAIRSAFQLLERLETVLFSKGLLTPIFFINP